MVFRSGKYCNIIYCNVLHSSRKIKGDFVDCEQVEYILNMVSSEEYIEVDFYAYNGMPLCCIDSNTRVWSTEKGLLIIDNGQYTYFVNIADLSHVILRDDEYDRS